MALLLEPALADSCRRLADRLNLPLIEQTTAAYPFVLKYADGRLALQQTGAKAPGPVSVDFTGGKADYRRNKGGGELIVKAVGGDRQNRPSVVDATAGLGRDSFVLASWGCTVTLCERSAVIAALLEDGLRRACQSADEDLAPVLRRMDLQQRDAVSYLSDLDAGRRPDVVLIDPMFPPSGKSALVKKEMRAFHQVVGEDVDSASLLEVALGAATHRVVVKRPKKAASLTGKAPSFSVSGKAIRFDVYTLKAFVKKG